MAHKGVREFTSEELSGIALGQCGFKVITNATVESGVTAGYTGIQYFVALKVIEADADVEARSVTAGDDLTLASAGSPSNPPANISSKKKIKFILCSFSNGKVSMFSLQILFPMYETEIPSIDVPASITDG